MALNQDDDLAMLDKVLISKSITGKEKDELKNKFILLSAIYLNAEQLSIAKPLAIEEQEELLFHRYFPITEGIGSQVNTFNSFFDNINSVDHTKTELTLLDKDNNKYAFKVESILLHYLLAYAHNVELGLAILDGFIDFDALVSRSKKFGQSCPNCRTVMKKTADRLTAGDKINLLEEFFGQDAKKLFSDFQVSLRNNVQHFDFRLYSDTTGTYIKCKSRKLTLSELFLINKKSNLLLTTILIFFMIKLSRAKNLNAATYLKIIVDSCNRLY